MNRQQPVVSTCKNDVEERESEDIAEVNRGP